MKILMNLHKRDNGIYYAVWRDNNGKQRWKSLKTKDKATAKRLYNQLKHLYLQGKIAKLEDAGTNIAIGKCAEEYLDYLEKTKEQNTADSARYVIRKFVEFLGEKTTMRSINAKIIDEYILYRLDFVKKTTINKDLRTLRAFFNKAIEWEYIKKSPITSKKFLRIDEKPKRYLTKDEINKILNNTNDIKFKSFILFLLLTGCRRNEALNLSWRDIDFKNRTITINKSKTHRMRTIPISDEVYELLTNLKKTTRSFNKVFEYQDRYISRKFHKYVKSLGIECRLHDLRHTFASLLVSSNIQIRIIQDLLGHKDIKSTLVYTHTQEKEKSEAVKKVSSFIKIVK